MRPMSCRLRAPALRGAPLVLLALAAPSARAQDAIQPADTVFDSVVVRPAFSRGTRPRIAIDAAHGNFHTMRGRYHPFAALLAGDGFRVGENARPFAPGSLDGVDVLVVANALGSQTGGGPGAPAFTPAECDAVHDWVSRGGALLLIADHEPAGAAARRLAERFGVDMSTGRTVDDPHSDWTSGSPTWLVFGVDTGARILDHPITRGRDSTERIRRVVAFTGQSLKGPPGSVGYLALAPGAVDHMPDGRDVPADGRAVQVAFTVGAGRVVVAGEAAMFTAQVAFAPGLGERRFGFTWPNTDDRQLALNVVRWLVRAVK